MYCSECGHAAHGKFCSHCGTRLQGGECSSELVTAELAKDWQHEVRYDVLLKYPEVRSMVEESARQAPKRLSGEQFLALAEKLIPIGVPMEGMAAVAQAFYARLGIQTGKQRTGDVAAPIGQVLVNVLCSLARQGQTLRRVTQAEDGCLIEATLPSDMFALEGDLFVGVSKDGERTRVTASTRISGQLFDWGKSTRCLERIFGDLERSSSSNGLPSTLPRREIA